LEYDGRYIELNLRENYKYVIKYIKYCY